MQNLNLEFSGLTLNGLFNQLATIRDAQQKIIQETLDNSAVISDTEETTETPKTMKNLTKSEIWSLVKEQQEKAPAHHVITLITWKTAKVDMIKALELLSQPTISHVKTINLVDKTKKQPVVAAKKPVRKAKVQLEAANINDSAWTAIPQSKKQGSGLRTSVSQETRAISAYGRGENANYGSQVLNRRQAMLDQLRNK
jgi:hypothetical protein